MTDSKSPQGMTVGPSHILRFGWFLYTRVCEANINRFVILLSISSLTFLICFHTCSFSVALWRIIVTFSIVSVSIVSAIVLWFIGVGIGHGYGVSSQCFGLILLLHNFISICLSASFWILVKDNCSKRHFNDILWHDIQAKFMTLFVLNDLCMRIEL